MKTRTIATLTALTLAVTTGMSANAAGSAVTVAEPVDGIEVIVVRAKRPETLITDEVSVVEAAPVAAADEIEVMTVTATRADQLAAIRELAREGFLARAATAPRIPMWNGGSVPRGAYRHWAGMPVR